jgi:hypothetical protein
MLTNRVRREVGSVGQFSCETTSNSRFVLLASLRLQSAKASVPPRLQRNIILLYDYTKKSCYKEMKLGHIFKTVQNRHFSR